MVKIETWILVLSLFISSCTSSEMDYSIVELHETENGAVIFETYNYDEPIGTFHLYMNTDYALRIYPYFRNIFDEWKDKWTIEYIIYDSNNNKKYTTNNVHMLNNILQNEIPQGIKLYEYVIQTSWLPNDSYKETIQIIEYICKINNIEFIKCRGDLNPEMKEIPVDYINTFWCIRCMTFLP
jgi:hypothetical protein